MIVKMFIFSACTAAFLIIQVQSRLFSLEDLQACFKKNELSQEMNLWNVSDEKARGVVDCTLGKNEAVSIGKGRHFLNELMEALRYATDEYNEYSHNLKDEVRSERSARSADVKSSKSDGGNCSSYDCYVVSDSVQNTSQLIGVYEACLGRSNITLHMNLTTVTAEQAKAVIDCIREKNGNNLTSREVLLFDELMPILEKAGCEVRINIPGNNVTITKNRPEPQASRVRVARSPPRKIIKRPRPRYIRCYFNAVTCF